MKLHSRWVEDTLGRMSLSEKIAQLISARALSHYTSSDSAEYRRLVGLAERLKVGGLIFFQGNSIGQQILTKDLQRRSRVPMLVSQDMEFGPGMRLPHATAFPSMMAVGATKNADFAYEVGAITARESRALGVQQVHAPVADINSNVDNPIINTRAFGGSPDAVAKMVSSYIKGVQDERQIATVKHFPGHGDTAIDSHLSLPTLDRSRQQLTDRELIPFVAALEAGVRSVMIGHLAVPSLDPSNVPASLSAPIVTGLLREELKYDGLVVTDAMDMQAITNGFGIGEAAVLAIEAGIDMLLMPADEYEAHSAILTAVQSGRLTEPRIDQSVRRILREKLWVDLPHAAVGTTADLRENLANRHSRNATKRVAEASITLMYDNAGATIEEEAASVGVVALYDEQCSPYHHALCNALRVEDNNVVSTFRVDAEIESRCDELVGRVNVIVVAAFVRVRSHAGRIGLIDGHTALIERLIRSGTRVVLLSLGSPYIGKSFEQSASAFVCAYSGCDASQVASAQALLGLIPFNGQLPT